MCNQAISGMFLLDTHSSAYLNAQSSWKQISDYLMFLTIRNGGCSKSDSGSLSISFGTHWTNSDGKVCADIGGYDLQTGSRHTHFEADSEEALKSIVLDFLETERKTQLRNADVDDESFGF